MLALPVLLPVLLCFIAHLLYALMPDVGFSYRIENGRIYYTFLNGEAMRGVGVGYDALATHLTAALGIYPVLVGLVVQQSILLMPSYLVFVAIILWWTHKKPFEFIRRVVWKLPLLYYPFFLLGGITQASLMGWLNVQVMALPVFVIVAYLYVAVAWAIVPTRYKNARAL